MIDRPSCGLALATLQTAINERDALIARQRALLEECLSYALGRPIGVSSDLWERVTEILGK